MDSFSTSFKVGRIWFKKKWHFAFIFIAKHAVLLNSTNQLIHPNVSFVFSFESFSFVFERCCVLDFKVRILWVLCKRGFYKVQLRFWCAATLNLPTSSQAPSRLLWICKTSGLSWLHFWGGGSSFSLSPCLCSVQDESHQIYFKYWKNVLL